MPAKGTLCCGEARERSHLEEDTIDGSDKALDDEQPLPAAQTPQSVHVEKPSSKRRPYDLCHTSRFIRPTTCIL